MTHEPECPIGNSDDPLTFYAARQSVAIVCVCANIRAAYTRGHQIGYRTGCEEQAGRDAYDRHDIERLAYQRGREDAANAIVRVSRWQYPERADNRWVLDADEAVAAARGDVPCAHTRTQYTREVCWCGDAVDVCEDCGIDVHECGLDGEK